MISIESYLKLDDEYINVFEYEGSIKDSDYIDGAICLDINGVKLISMEMWDYIDQLWAYFTIGICDLFNRKVFKTRFPDQPIEVVFKPIRDQALIIVNCHSEVKVIVDRNEFVRVMSEHALLFFEKLSSIKGVNKSQYRNEIEKLERLRG